MSYRLHGYRLQNPSLARDHLGVIKASFIPHLPPLKHVEWTQPALEYLPVCLLLGLPLFLQLLCHRCRLVHGGNWCLQLVHPPQHPPCSCSCLGLYTCPSTSTSRMRRHAFPMAPNRLVLEHSRCLHFEAPKQQSKNWKQVFDKHHRTLCKQPDTCSYRHSSNVLLQSLRCRSSEAGPVPRRVVQVFQPTIVCQNLKLIVNQPQGRMDLKRANYAHLWVVIRAPATFRTNDEALAVTRQVQGGCTDVA
jgi:hypothetical protein